MARHFPLFANVEGRVCTVVGGGTIGGHRAALLVEAGAVVRVVSPEVSTDLADAIARGAVAEHRARPYRADDLDGSALVVAATASAETNQRVREDAAARGIWCNVVDAPTTGDFIVPATVRRGDLTIAVTTGGASPVVAADIRTRIEGTFGPEWADLLALLTRLRDDLKLRHPDPSQRAARVRAVLESDVRGMLSQGQMREAERLARTVLELGD